MSLLDVAKKSKGRKKPIPRTAEQIELALGWLRGEVGSIQVAHALEMPPSSRASIYTWLVLSIRAAYENGLVEIKQ